MDEDHGSDAQPQLKMMPCDAMNLSPSVNPDADSVTCEKCSGV